MGCEDQLAWKFLFTPSRFRRAILTRKVGQTDLLLDMRSGFISRSVRASLCVQRLRFVPPKLTSRLTHLFAHTDQLI